MASARIMVVEDEQITAADIEDMLTSLGYAVTAAVGSGEEALRQAAEDPPDLVLMDIRLKGKCDGIETALQLRQRFDIPVIYLTAHADQETLNRAKLAEPLGYLDFLKLLAEARLVMTDSGGIQEETTMLNVPCLTLRTSTERPATVEAGLNRLVGLDPQRIWRAAEETLASPPRAARPPEKWDGRAAQRIVDVLLHCDEHGIPRR